MFRIDRNNVNLGVTKSIRVDSSESTEAGAIGEITPQATASADDMAQIRAHEILSNAEQEARAKAEQIIMDARDEVAEMISTAREEADEERRRAFQEGYAEGATEGKRVYAEELDKKIKEEDDMLKRVLSEIYDEWERTFSGLEDEVVGLALEIVRKVIGPAEDEIGGVFESLVRNALKQITPEGKIVIRVSPDEYERFFSLGNIAITLDSGVSVTATVLRDASLGGGDCIIDTEQETVNAGLNSQLKYIALAFEEMINV